MGAEQKVAIITRAAEGIGPGLVRGFLQKNYRVVAVLSCPKYCFQSDLLHVVGDLGEERTADRVITAALTRFGRIDTLVNNAAVPPSQAFTRYGPADWDGMTHTNLDEFMYITQRAVEVMLRKNCGHVINITAAVDCRPAVHTTPFLVAIAMGCLDAATQSLAIELAPERIRVNAIAARFNAPCSLLPRQALLSQSLSADVGVDPSHVVSAALYLDTAPFVTGEILHVNGSVC